MWGGERVVKGDRRHTSICPKRDLGQQERTATERHRGRRRNIGTLRVSVEEVRAKSAAPNVPAACCGESSFMGPGLGPEDYRAVSIGRHPRGLAPTFRPGFCGRFLFCCCCKSMNPLWLDSRNVFRAVSFSFLASAHACTHACTHTHNAEQNLNILLLVPPDIPECERCLVWT